MLAINKAIELDDKHPEAYAIRGLISGDLENFEKSIEINPNFAIAYAWYVTVADDLDPAEGIKLLDKAYQLNPLSTVVANNYAIRLFYYGEREKAWQVLRQMESLTPDAPAVFNTKVNLYSYAGEFGKSLYYRKLSVHKYPSDALSQWQLGRRLYALGLKDEAYYHIEKSSYAAVKHVVRGNFEYYRDLVRQQYPRAEDDVAGLLLRGSVELLEGNYEESIKFYRQADCMNYCLPYWFAMKFSGGENEQEALEFINKRIVELEQIGEDPSAGVVRNLARLYMAKGDFDGAIAYIEKRLDRFNEPFRDNSFNSSYAVVWDQLTAHEKWSEVEAKNEQVIAEQRQIYLDLIAKDPVLSVMTYSESN
jgi:tetratricopeptide (TPR) repeat protein